jgi:5S rRNA maturation endonuclease (ribonuclease M5)
LVQNEAKTESQLELKRKNEIKKLIVETDPDYKGVESRVYSSLNTYAVREYNKTLIEMNDEEMREVFEYFDLR